MNQIIDLKDRKLLGLLDFNARMPLSDLAKSIGLSKQTTDYRLKALIKQGIIEGFFPVINTPMLGYNYCRLLVQFATLDPAIEKELRDYIFSSQTLFWALALGGEFDYLFVYWVKSLAEFENCVMEFEAKFGKFIRRKSEQVITNVIHLPHKIFGLRQATRFDLKETSVRIHLDELDRRVLRQLSMNSRQPLSEIAAGLDSSPKVVGYRIKKMQENNFLVAFRPIINYEKLGLTYYKIFFSLSFAALKELNAFEAFLLNNPAVLYVVKGIGMDADFDVEILAESNQAFFDFIASAKSQFPNMVQNYRYLIYTKTVKVNYLPFV